MRIYIYLAQLRLYVNVRVYIPMYLEKYTIYMYSFFLYVLLLLLLACLRACVWQFKA